MFYEAEFSFFKNILGNMNLPFSILTGDSPPEALYDRGLSQLINNGRHYEKMIFNLLPHIRANTFYRSIDAFQCNYILFLLPDIQPRTIMLIGPYLTDNFTKEQILALAQGKKLPDCAIQYLDDFYTKQRIIRNDEFLLCLLNTFGAQIWGGTNHFKIFDTNTPGLFADFLDSGLLFESNIEKSMPDSKMITERYRMEYDFMHAVSIGQASEAETIINNLNLLELTTRNNFSLERMRSYVTVANTLLRKAAEYGGVHPIHIHLLFQTCMQEAENICSLEEGKNLIRHMVRKYCMLVQNHSHSQYSPPIKQAITEIELNLSKNLNLRTLARQINISPNHLSTLFRKETGSTLTDFINQKRIEHALLLLNTSNWQIQIIAQDCGITDANYFTKLFKRIVGMTPNEYRRQILQAER